MNRHPPEFQDTDPAAMKVWLELLRKKTPGEKLAVTLELSGMAMALARAGERLRHPEANEREVFLRAASRWLDRDLMIRAYGWDPDNVIHLQSAYKIDLFPLRRDEFSRSEFGRREFTEVRSLGTEPIECAVASPEDTILRKLAWYRDGGETSERQWNDLRGVVRVSGAKLDREYMRKWAEYLKVTGLLEQLLGEKLES